MSGENGVVKGEVVHWECLHKLRELGETFDFEVTSKLRGKKYELANPDCLWYYKGKGEKALRKIAYGDGPGCRHIPLVAFEVASTEGQKALRGSLMSLQITNAGASVIVLVGKSAKYKSFLKKLTMRFSNMRIRIWSKKDVDDMYEKFVTKSSSRTSRAALQSRT
jgi:hypothetical protein